MGVDDELVDEAVTMQCLDPNQTLAGTVCRVKAVARASKKSRDDKGNPFEYVMYTWYTALDTDEIKKTLGDERVAKFFPNGL